MKRALVAIVVLLFAAGCSKKEHPMVYTSTPALASLCRLSDEHPVYSADKGWRCEKEHPLVFASAVAAPEITWNVATETLVISPSRCAGSIAMGQTTKKVRDVFPKECKMSGKEH